MNEIVKQTLLTLVVFLISWVIIKLIFKKSIMYRFSVITLSFTLFATYISKLQLFLGGYTQLIFTPLGIIIGTLVYWYINKILTHPLEKSINQLRELSEGKLDIKIEKTILLAS